MPAATFGISVQRLVRRLLGPCLYISDRSVPSKSRIRWRTAVRIAKGSIVVRTRKFIPDESLPERPVCNIPPRVYRIG